jgi:hypothetical protein
MSFGDATSSFIFVGLFRSKVHGGNSSVGAYPEIATVGGEQRLCSPAALVTRFGFCSIFAIPPRVAAGAK